MLLGKRPRPPVKRTTSMTEITFDLTPNDDHQMMMNPQPYDPHNPFNDLRSNTNYSNNNNNNNNNYYQGNYNYSNINNMGGSPRTTYRRNSADFVDTAHFLRSCGLCKRRLVPTRDIYMYRGDTAFCSLECRQQQMTQDERLEKCSLASKKEAVSSSASAARSQVAAKGETVVAL